jgi:Domain of unknown function (DUF1833)
MRPISARARQALYAQETAEVFLALLVIRHPTLPTPLRFVNNVEDIWSRADGDAAAQQYFGCPFTLGLPDERDDQLPAVQLAIDNVDQAIVAAVRDMVTAPTMTLYIVLAATPDVVEAGPLAFTLKNAQYDALQVTGTLAFADVLNEPFPWRTFTPPDWPGVFA